MISYYHFIVTMSLSCAISVLSY